MGRLEDATGQQYSRVPRLREEPNKRSGQFPNRGSTASFRFRRMRNRPTAFTRRALTVAGCGGSAQLLLETQAVDGYRTRDDALAAGQAHIRAMAAEKSPSLCKGTCSSKTSNCKAIVFDDDLAAAVRTFMHLDEDGDPSFGWLTAGTITVHCACVERRRPNKALSPAHASREASAEPPPKQPARQTTRRRRAAGQRPQASESETP
jgi:hypothetical protein